MRRSGGLVALAAQYDVFLIDVFGTLHDGARAYPGALAVLAALRREGARVVLLSNSGRRSAPNAARLPHFGLTDAGYDLLLSSGEVAWQLLRDGAIPDLRDARRCLPITRDGDRSVLEGLAFETVTRVEDADFVLLGGSEGERRPMSDYEALLAPAARRRLPMLCCNPDRTMLTEVGPAFGAGQIAERYEAMGGPVTWIGKPHAAIYDAAFAALGDPPRRRAIGVGDSVEHDIAGARRAGCAAALVLTGIAAGAAAADIAAMSGQYGARPDFVLESLAGVTVAG